MLLLLVSWWTGIQTRNSNGSWRSMVTSSIYIKLLVCLVRRSEVVQLSPGKCHHQQERQEGQIKRLHSICPSGVDLILALCRSSECLRQTSLEGPPIVLPWGLCRSTRPNCFDFQYEMLVTGKESVLWNTVLDIITDCGWFRAARGSSRRGIRHWQRRYLCRKMLGRAINQKTCQSFAWDMGEGCDKGEGLILGWKLSLVYARP